MNPVLTFGIVLAMHLNRLVSCKSNTSVDYFVSSNGKQCDDLPPFVLESVGRGVDLASVDLQPRLQDLKNGFVPFREQVVALTCEHNERLVLSNGQKLSLPDQVLRVLEQPQIDFTRHGMAPQDASEYRRRQAQSFGVSMVEGAFRAAPGYRRLKHVPLAQKRIRDHVRFERLRRHLWLREVPSLRLAQSVAIEFAKLPEEHSDGTRAYEDFIDKYGTHFLTRISFGDAAQIEFEREINLKAQNSYSYVRNESRHWDSINQVSQSSGDGSPHMYSEELADWFSELGKELIYNCSTIQSFGRLTEDRVLVLERDRLWRLHRTEELRWRVLSVYGGSLEHCDQLNQTSNLLVSTQLTSGVTNVNPSFANGVNRKWKPKDLIGEWAGKGLRELFSTWQQREMLPWPLYGKAAPLDLLLPDGPRKESFKKAVKLHLEAAELEDGN